MSVIDNHRSHGRILEHVTFQKEVPKGINPYYQKSYYCESCKLPLAVGFVLIDPSTKKIKDYTIGDLKRMVERGVELETPADTEIKPVEIGEATK